jgi:hypothetical protein
MQKLKLNQPRNKLINNKIYKREKHFNKKHVLFNITN